MINIIGWYSIIFVALVMVVIVQAEDMDNRVGGFVLTAPLMFYLFYTLVGR